MSPFVVGDHTQSISFGQENHSSTPDLTKYFTLGEIAHMLGCTYETVRRRAKRGELTYVQKPGCSIRVTGMALAEYLERYTWPAQANHHGLSSSQTGSSGTSQMDGTAIVQKLRMRRQHNAS